MDTPSNALEIGLKCFFVLYVATVSLLSHCLTSDILFQDLALFSHAVRTLANLDRDFCKDESYEDGVYLLHPQGRYT